MCALPAQRAGSELSLELQTEHWASAPPPPLSSTPGLLLARVSKAVRTNSKKNNTWGFSWSRREEGGCVLHPLCP